MDAKQHLKELVAALDSSHISSWQTTAGWQKQLDAARAFLDGGPKYVDLYGSHRAPNEIIMTMTDYGRSQKLCEVARKGSFVDILGAEYAITHFGFEHRGYQPSCKFNFQEVFKL